MELRPLKLIKAVDQSSINNDDVLRKPKVPNTIGKKSKSATNGIHVAKDRILYQGKDLASVIREAAQTNPQFLSKLAKELKEKREQLKEKTKKDKRMKLPFMKGKLLKKLNRELSMIAVYLTKIAEHLKSKYDQTQSGIHVAFDDNGQLIMNGINVNALINQCRENATPQSKIYLAGLKKRLFHVLENKARSPLYERIREVTLQLIDEINPIIEA